MQRNQLGINLAAIGVVAGIILLALSSMGRSAPVVRADSPSLPFKLYVPQVVCDSCEPPSLEILFIDVGQGDATLITINGHRLLIDGGRSSTLVTQRLLARGVTDLDAVLATHPDADHVGGLANVLATFAVERIYVNGNSSATATYAEFLAAAAGEPGAQLITLSRGQTIQLGPLRLAVLHPDILTGDTNVDSIVIGLTCGSVDVLLTGDAESPSEASMLVAGLIRHVEVLKVGHHGSNTSSSAAFLKATKPEVAVISAGRTNPYGHPHPDVLARLAAVGASVVFTDTTADDDSVTMTSDCQTYSFSP